MRQKRSLILRLIIAVAGVSVNFAPQMKQSSSAMHSRIAPKLYIILKMLIMPMVAMVVMVVLHQEREYQKKLELAEAFHCAENAVNIKRFSRSLQLYKYLFCKRLSGFVVAYSLCRSQPSFREIINYDHRCKERMLMQNRNQTRCQKWNCSWYFWHILASQTLQL